MIGGQMIINNKDTFDDELKKQKDKEVYDFTGFVFQEELSLEGYKFEKKAVFNKAQFIAKVKFGRTQFNGDVSFSEAKFQVGVSFWDTQFSGRADFSGTKFHENADFRQATFADDAVFGEAHFSGRADFGGARYNERADFRQTSYEEDAVFGETQFLENASFRGAKFSKNADYRHAHFSREAIFVEAIFKEKASFWETKFSNRADFGRAQFSAEASFVGTQFCGETNFSLAKFYDIGSFDNADFQQGKNCFMEGSYFYDISGLLEFIELNKKKFKFSRHPHKNEFLPDQFAFILGEKAAAKYPLINRKIKDDIYLQSFKKKHRKLHFLWWLFADCGRSLKPWAIWSFGTALFFAFLYALIGVEAFKPRAEGYTWFSFIYYSFVTFTTLGFGDITPIKWYTEILVTLEVIVGYGILGILISILGNKVARRS